MNNKILSRLLPFFKGKLFFQVAIVGTHSFNSSQSLLSFKKFPAFGSSKFTYIVLQKGFDLISRHLTVPIEQLLNLSETLILSVNITFSPIHNFNFAVGSPVWERPILWYRYETTICRYIFTTILYLHNNNFESTLSIQASFSSLTK